ncbi:MAG: hypothetical protein AAF618_12740, partial [Pseudomonadota bacterium]
DLFTNFADALRAGSVVRFEVNGGEPIEFGLRGSSAEIGNGRCGTQGAPRTVYMALEFWVPNAGWEAGFRTPSSALINDPVLVHRAREPFQPSIRLTCDRRISVASPTIGYGFPSRGNIQLEGQWDGVVIPLAFDGTEGGGMVSQPLTEAELRALSGAEIAQIVFNDDVEPGEFTTGNYRMEGFGELYGTLECLPPAGPITAAARVDGSGDGAGWVATDFSVQFYGPRSREPIPGAVYRASREDVPTLSLNCEAEPILVDPWPGPNFTVRMEIDGSAAKTREVDFGSWRAFYLPAFSEDNATWQREILNGSTLRLTLLSDPRLDVLYTLDGLQTALREAGC